MKYLRAILLSGLVLSITPAIAEDDHSLLSGETENYIGYGFIVVMLLLFIIAMLVILRAIKVLTQVILKSEGYSKEQIIAELKPAKAEKAEKAEKTEKVK